MDAPAPRAVFLSYAREDTGAARRIAEALRAFGVEVWFDQNELRGGDAWDHKIRKQIRDCTVFVPLISDATQLRTEGYFRREWRLAVDRSHDMLHGVAFILPVVIDRIPEAGAAVPEEFLRFQWTHLAGGQPTAEFVEHVKRVMQAPERGGTRHAIPGGTRSGLADTPRPPFLRRPAALAGFALVAALVAGIIAFAPRPGLPPRGAEPPPAGGAPPAAVAAPEKSIAVLAFANLSDDRGNEYFSDGISEELLNILAQVQGLKVAARTSAFFFKGKQASVPEIAQKLGVAYVVEGSVQKAGSRVKITVQLAKGADGFHAWSRTFTRELKDVFALQNEIAGEIAQNLRLTLALPRAGRAVNPDAHRLVLEARHLWNLRTAEGFDRAEAALLQAVQIDADFAPAHATLADVYAMRAAYRMLDGSTEAETANDTDRAQAAARRAIALEPTVADPYPAFAYALMIAGRLRESEEIFQKALALNPNHAVAHSWYANLRASEGRLDEALAGYRRSAELDPLWKVNLGTYAAMLGFAGQAQASLELTDRVIASQAELFLPSMATRGMALVALGRTKEAVEAARLILRNPDLAPRWYADSAAIWILGQGGERTEAATAAEALLRRLGERSYQRGCVLAALGRFDEALPYLERTPPRAKHRMYWEPIWDPWREDPRFHQLLARLKCAEEYAVARRSLARMNQAK